MPDIIQRFLFDDTDIRGELVQLNQSYVDTLSSHHYPEPAAKLLGEFLVAATLLSATLKFEGTLILQARSKGEVPLIMAEATSNNTVRAIARNADQASSEDFHTLLADGQMAITIEPKQGKRYQGIVNMEGENLARCLEDYFKQSEQLSTRLWLAADTTHCAGMLLQELPADQITDGEQRDAQWQHACHLADTLQQQELLELDTDTLLHRLYHQDPVRLFPAETISFRCSCSQQRTLDALASLGKSELEEIIAEQGHIAIQCEFCNHEYRFESQEIATLFQRPLH